MYIRTYVFVSFETTPVIRIQILIDPTFNNMYISELRIFTQHKLFVTRSRVQSMYVSTNHHDKINEQRLPHLSAVSILLPSRSRIRPIILYNGCAHSCWTNNICQKLSISFTDWYSIRRVWKLNPHRTAQDCDRFNLLYGDGRDHGIHG